MELSLRKNFTILNLPITDDQLIQDGMHINIAYLPTFYHHIQQYFNDTHQQQIKSSQSKRRSRAAKTRRNRKRHEKLRKRQALQTVMRPIARIWELHDLKSYLKYKNIRYARLPEIRNHQLCIQFNNINYQQQAEQILTLHDFDENSYYHWISTEH